MEVIYTYAVDFILAFPIIIPVVTYVIPIIMILALSKKLCYIIASILTALIIFILLVVDSWSIGFTGLILYAFVHWTVILCSGNIIKSIYSKYQRNKSIKFN